MKSSTPTTSLSNPRHHVLLLVFLIMFLTTTINITKAGFLIPIAHVCIINDLRADLNLTTHCKSKDDDIGVHVLLFGENFTITFRPNVLGTTLFHCSMEWYLSTVKHFDIYDVGRDNKICKFCKHYNWKIRVGGPCMYNKDTDKFDICREWKKV